MGTRGTGDQNIKEVVSLTEATSLFTSRAARGVGGWGSRSASFTVWPLLTNSISSWPISTFHWLRSPPGFVTANTDSLGYPCRDLEEAPCLGQTVFLRPLLFGLASHSRGRCRCSWHSRSAGCRGREKEVSAPVTAIFYDLRHSSGNLAKVTQCAAPR